MSALDKLPTLARDKIDKYGGTCGFASTGTTAYDPTTSKNVPVGGQSQAGLKCLVEDMKGQTFKSNLVVAGDKKLTIAALAIVVMPKPGDKFTLPDGVFQVAPGDSVKTTYAGNIAVLYEVQARK